MKVLIVGQPGYFVKPLIQRLYQENMDVYLLYSHRQEGWKSGREVHEEYIFPLDSQSVSYVTEDVKPDQIIFAGAADSSYRWENVTTDGVNMTAALSNVLLCARENGTARVHFISSDEVFDRDGMQKQPEGANIPAESQKGFVLAQCENLCLSYASDRLQTTVLRIAGLYGEPVFRDEACGRVVNAVKAAMEGGHTPDAEHGYYPTYTSDAVEAIYNLLYTEAPLSGIYHISGEQLVSDAAVASLLNQEKPPVAPTDAVALQMDRLRAITPFEQKHRLADTVGRIKERLVKLQAAEPTKKGHATAARIWKFLRPAVETLVFFALLVLLTLVLKMLPGLSQLDIMLFYVLFVAATFGKPATVLAVVLASAFFVWEQVHGGTEFAAALLSMPMVCRLLNLFITGMITAHCRDRLKWKYDDAADEKNQLLFELDTVRSMNDSNVRIKRHLEEQIVNMDDSLGKIYSIVSRLESVEPNQVMYNAVEIVKQIMHADTVAIYTVSNEWYARQTAYSGEEDCPLNKSLMLEQYPAMMDTLNQGQVFVNTSMDSSLPLMVSPVMENGKLSTMLMVWNVEFKRLTPYHVNLFMVLSNMISGSLSRAEAYAEAVHDRQYIPGTDILNADSFRKTLTMVQDAVRQNLTAWSVLELEPGAMVYPQLSGLLTNMLRSNDYIGLTDGGKIWVLLANSDRTGAEIVLKRMENAHITGKIVEIEQ